ncbi:uncharacterized protein MYCFIDRAFT_178459 [Pseudocercospora fijiensis CIRAD86]|uniref:Uncharacterized protein n=1 Tax=Pseudocercospora fijiensis (strain CIRAD86) TaxID=383855 RepID=M2ZGR0_PSEFD|nr:uncharacterized protein MYCFIDRAFT_178459 [Pseudocercospora fijiensis CIRAD86]EME78304.1 hypothetical protein MYCFIDRAFT_178459 [Pseudocercospora fijiensis CIRAD86]
MRPPLDTHHHLDLIPNALLSNMTADYVPTDPASSATARYLEHVTKSIMQAVNDRNFNPSSEPWSLLAPQFRNDPAGRFDSASFLPSVVKKQEKGIIHRPQTKEEHIRFHQEMSIGAPEYFNKVIDATCTCLDEEACIAKVMMSTETHGIPGGLVRPAVSTLEFRKISGSWMATRLRTLPGYDVAGTKTLTPLNSGTPSASSLHPCLLRSTRARRWEPRASVQPDALRLLNLLAILPNATLPERTANRDGTGIIHCHHMSWQTNHWPSELFNAASLADTIVSSLIREYTTRQTELDRYIK